MVTNAPDQAMDEPKELNGADKTKAGGTSKPSKWSELPVELKEMILAQRLTMTQPLNWRTHPSHLQRAFLPLMLTSRETNTIAARVWGQRNAFRLVYSGKNRREYAKDKMEPVQSLNPSLVYRSHFRYPSSHIAMHIQRLEVQLRILDLTWNPLVINEEDKYACYNAWRVLMSPRKWGDERDDVNELLEDKESREIAWQSTLLNLRDLRIEIEVVPADGYTCRTLDYCPTGMGKNMDTFFQGVQCKLRAERVVVQVDTLRCGKYETNTKWVGWPCPHKCAAKLGMGIEALIERKT